ncbi:MAG: DDE transposase, partial [Reichenbachiella sp.]
MVAPDEHFLGYSGFSTKPPFDPSLFVEIRKRMGDDLLAEMNLRILRLSESNKGNEKDDQDPPDPTHKGNLLMDATAAPQEIAYPTDLNLLNRSR